MRFLLRSYICTHGLGVDHDSVRSGLGGSLRVFDMFMFIGVIRWKDKCDFIIYVNNVIENLDDVYSQ